MTVRTLVSAAAIVAAGLVPTAAIAAATATATADLNIRSGPGPEYTVIGAVPMNTRATILGCIEDSLWCQVSYGGHRGWAYSRYLATQLSGHTVVLSEQRHAIGIPTITYEVTAAAPPAVTTTTTTTAPVATTERPAPGVSTTTGAATGAITGAIIAGPVGAAVGGVAGAALGTAVNPPQRVTTYVTSNPAQPVYLQGEAVVGARLPETVELRPVPDYEYEYVYVNRQPVLVEPGTRRIVYIYR
jgi:uncharacterized protein YraI